jgi:hypothetical protein
MIQAPAAMAEILDGTLIDERGAAAVTSLHVKIAKDRILNNV